MAGDTVHQRTASRIHGWANEVPTSSVGPQSPCVRVHGRTAAPAPPASSERAQTLVPRASCPRPPGCTLYPPVGLLRSSKRPRYACRRLCVGEARLGHSERFLQQQTNRELYKDVYGNGDLQEPEEPPARLERDP